MSLVLLVLGIVVAIAGEPAGLAIVVIATVQLSDGLLFARSRVVVTSNEVKVVNRYRSTTVRRMELRGIEPTQRLARWGGPFLMTKHGQVRLVCCQRGWRAMGWGGLPSPDAGRLADLLDVPVIG